MGFRSVPKTILDETTVGGSLIRRKPDNSGWEMIKLPANTLTLSAAPTAADGVDGAYAIQLGLSVDDMNVWGPKTNGAWPLQADSRVTSKSAESATSALADFVKASGNYATPMLHSPAVLMEQFQNRQWERIPQDGADEILVNYRASVAMYFQNGWYARHFTQGGISPGPGVAAGDSNGHYQIERDMVIDLLATKEGGDGGGYTLGLQWQVYANGVWSDVTGRYAVTSNAAANPRITDFDRVFLKSGEYIRLRVNGNNSGQNTYAGNRDVRISINEVPSKSNVIHSSPDHRTTFYDTTLANTTSNQFKSFPETEELKAEGWYPATYDVAIKSGTDGVLDSTEVGAANANFQTNAALTNTEGTGDVGMNLYATGVSTRGKSIRITIGWVKDIEIKTI